MTQVEQKPSATATFTVGASDFTEGSHNSSFSPNVTSEQQSNSTVETDPTRAHNNNQDNDQEEAIYEEESSNHDHYNGGDSDDKNKSSEIVEDDGNIDTSDLMFKKKEVNSRTQSFHSVLSAASLKSLNHQFKQPYNNHPRNNSMSSTVNTCNSKNFQSFIQAPVLSSISNLKTMESEKDIGKQLPFQNKNSTDNSVDEPEESPTNDCDYDEELIIQQQKLTLNALKKLSLSPMPISKIEEDIKKSISRKSSLSKMDKDSKNKNMEPYQPAEVDLSSFASLTRQPKTPQQMDRDSSKPNIQQSRVTASGIQTNNDITKDTNINDTSNTNINTTTNNNNINVNNEINIQASANKAKMQFSNADIYSKNKQNNLHENTSMNRNTSLSDLDKSKATRAYNNAVSNQLQPTHELDNNLKGNNNRNNFPNRVGKENTYPDPSTQNFSRGERNKIPAAVVPPQNINIRANSNHNVSSIQVKSHISNGNQVLQPQPTKQLQQIKGFRSPMYVPAVLRFTKSVSPSKTLNVTQSGHDNGQPFDSHKFDSHNEGINKRQYQPMNTTLSRMTSSDSMKSFTSNISMESNSSSIVSRSQSPSFMYGGDNLRGEPTRKHWIKDESVFKCGIPTCSKVFNFFERRHHCRKCGGIYCKEHTSHFLYINHLAQFTTGGRGTLSKVCDNCIKEYNEFMANEFGIHNVSKDKMQKKSQIQNENSANTIPTSPTSPAIPNKNKPYMAMKNITSKDVGNSTDTGGDQLVGSVPANWSWSSF